MQCFCGSQKPLTVCCEVYLKDEKQPETPEILMRSRYTAFCLKNMDYVKKTTDSQAIMDWTANEAWAREAEFTKLVVLRSSDEGNKGLVEFQAFFKMEINGQIQELSHHEISRFRKHQGVWYYRDGRVLSIPNKT